MTDSTYLRIKRTTLQEIADAVRTKTGSTDKIKVENIATSISSISSGCNLKPLLDATKSAQYLFDSYSGTSVSDFISPEDTENVERFDFMFEYCSYLKSVDINTSMATNMNGMFLQCTSLQELSDSFSTSNVTDLQNAFYWCVALKEIPNLNTSKVTNFYGAFNNCRSITSFSGIDMSSKPNTIVSMFGYCVKAEKIDFKYFYAPSSGYSGQVFKSCYSLKTIIIRDMDTSNYSIQSSAFDDCYNLKGTVNATYNPNGDVGSIYVPDSMVSVLKSSTNWSSVADAIKPLSEYVEE